MFPLSIWVLSSCVRCIVFARRKIRSIWRLRVDGSAGYHELSDEGRRVFGDARKKGYARYDLWGIECLDHGGAVAGEGEHTGRRGAEPLREMEA